MNRHGRFGTAGEHTYRAALRLSHRRRWTVYAVGGALWLSGALWLLLHYFFMGRGEFGPVPHPFESWSLRLHAAAAFAAMWLFGLVWGVHIIAGWRTHRQRVSGSTVVAVLIWLIATGYLLYYLGDDTWRGSAEVAHWLVGLTLPVVLVVHILRGRRQKKLRSMPERAEAAPIR